MEHFLWFGLIPNSFTCVLSLELHKMPNWSFPLTQTTRELESLAKYCTTSEQHTQTWPHFPLAKLGHFCTSHLKKSSVILLLFTGRKTKQPSRVPSPQGCKYTQLIRSPSGLFSVLTMLFVKYLLSNSLLQKLWLFNWILLACLSPPSPVVIHRANKTSSRGELYLSHGKALCNL